MANDHDMYPLFLYDYGTDGFHGEPIRIGSELALVNAMRTFVRDAIKEKREIRITDTGDLMCFHVYKGCIKFNGEKHHECENCKED